ncbi:hypothetical protein [Parapusillimonas granuli]|uniref:Uncharacterized protein n=1 Tax=Parapusillimonas granuli TaxID=380911 RepID=A0A853G668_9BURK|nr:hypothetical protein [Parapusillimonas granuli]MBB5217575.1 ABC-type hemin transport system ATPase subunit [Parapusillimonas granuli]NYT51799.1 hypothetical protein [Parapusillimonas granuli]
MTHDTLDNLSSLIDETKARSSNEAETRHKIIDFILHDVLSWPRNRVKVEDYIAPGFADYVLTKQDGSHLLFIEAKREGIYFELPIPHANGETSCFIGIAKLLTNENIKSAMTQVRSYCIDTGCEYAGITNGHEWVFFKTFEKGKRWNLQNAFVVRSLEFFRKEYTKARNSFSFTAIIDHASLPETLSTALPKDRSIYYPREKINSYSHTIKSNWLAARIRPAVNYYFGVISDEDSDFMERCYVSQREYQDTTDGMRSLIHDSISPYFEGYGVQQLDDTGKGGRLGGRLTKNLKNNIKGEVLVLFGGKGAGKSTFIKRLLHHNSPRWLLENARTCIIDLLNVPEDPAVIRDTTWTRLVAALDTEGLLQEARDQLTRHLFNDRFQVAEKQDLAGLSPKSEAYNTKLNALISSWKSDRVYCAERLVAYWKSKGRGAIVVVDNTDQYISKVQDFCFTLAQEIASTLGCVVLISMREERFYDSKIHGVLDAYQNSGFHISSPRPAEVFRKRLDYSVRLLKNENLPAPLLAGFDSKTSGATSKYFSILAREFSNDTSPLNGFLTACAHGDIRLSLDLFRAFLLSGYTNVDEMIENGHWNFQIHQVIKPVMIPDRYFYDESLSRIPNIFQLRTTRLSSHFTALRILRKLSKGLDKGSPSYFDIAELRAYFSETFGMLDDFEKNTDILLKHGFIEANNRLDEYSSSVDSIKITRYGTYMIEELAWNFTYLDLICTDCGIYDEQISNYLTEAAKEEYSLFLRGERVERVKVRLARVEEFIKYLESDESRERELYSLGMPVEEMFTAKIRATFESEKSRVLRSAKRQTLRRGI